MINPLEVWRFLPEPSAADYRRAAEFCRDYVRGIGRAHYFQKEITNMASVTLANVVDVFSYHAPTGDQTIQYEEIRQAGRVLAEKLLSNCPACDDTQKAVDLVRQAVMRGNSAIALGGVI